MALVFGDDFPRARLAVLLEHFAELNDDREAWRVAYPIEEVLLLVTCATIASCDDFDDIVAWGEHHLEFLRGLGEFHHGVPCALAARSAEPGRPGAVRPLLRGLGRRDVAGSA